MHYCIILINVLLLGQMRLLKLLGIHLPSWETRIRGLHTICLDQNQLLQEWEEEVLILLQEQVTDFIQIQILPILSLMCPLKSYLICFLDQIQEDQDLLLEQTGRSFQEVQTDLQTDLREVQTLVIRIDQQVIFNYYQYSFCYFSP